MNFARVVILRSLLDHLDLSLISLVWILRVPLLLLLLLEEGLFIRVRVLMLDLSYLN